VSTRPGGRRRAAATAAPGNAGGNAMLDVLADCSREQLAMCMEASGALARGFEALRAIGQRTAQETATRHQAAARRLREASAAGDVMAMPWTVWQDDATGAVRYWQELAAAALETQTRLLGSAFGHTFDSESALQGAAALEALETLPGMRRLVDSGAAIARHALAR